MRVLKWRLHLAIGAWAQARREIDRLKERVDSTTILSRSLATSQTELERMGKSLSATRERASQLAAQVNELQGFREQSDKARLELSRIQSQHAEEIEDMRKCFNNRWNEMRARADKRLADEERRFRRQQEQIADLSKKLGDSEDRVKWQQGQIAKLTADLAQSCLENEGKQSRINSLKIRLQQVETDKSKALDEVRGLNTKMTQREEEVSKMGLEFQERLRTFGEEMASSHRRNSELEKQLAEANARTSLAVEEYKNSAQFTEEHRAAYADAFRFGEEETRAKISQAYPELDLSFLEAMRYETRTPGTEETEYEEISDVDLEAILGADAVAEVSQRNTFEEGEPSHASPDAAAGDAGSDPKP